MTPRDGLLLASVVPLASVVAWVINRFRDREPAGRHLFAAAVGIGFCAGFFAIFEFADALPSEHYHWLLYVAIGAAIAGPVIVAQGVARWERILITLLATGLAAWGLQPRAWAEPPPAHWTLILWGELALLSFLIEPLPEHVSPRVVLLSMFATSFVLAALTAAIWNVSFGKLAALPGLALLGAGIATWFTGPPAAVRGTALAYALLIGGGAFIAGIEPDPPAWVLLAVPPAPAALWLCAKGPLSRPLPRKLLLGGLLLTAACLASVAAWIALTHGALDEGY